MDVCTKTFISKEYKKHREEYLFDREQSRLPEVQQVIQLEKQRDVYKDELRGLKNLVEQKMIEIAVIDRRINRRDITGMSGSKFIRRCPGGDCRGFLSSQWKCGVCDVRVCSKCYEIKSGEHVCNPDNVASTELIKNDSKPCPTCGIYIQKLEGCNQMWCTDCHTAFSWVTGTVVTGNIHNPHFFEARRNANGMLLRNINDVPCGGLPTRKEFTECGYKYTGMFPTSMINFVCYVEGLIMDGREPDNYKHRYSYMKGDIDEKRFKMNIHAADKRYHKQRELDDVYRMVTTTVSDILRQLVTSSSDMDVCLARKEITYILNYANGAIDAIAKKYKSKADYTLFWKYYKYHGAARGINVTYDNAHKLPCELGKVFMFTEKTYDVPGELRIR